MKDWTQEISEAKRDDYKDKVKNPEWQKKNKERQKKLDEAVEKWRKEQEK